MTDLPFRQPTTRHLPMGGGDGQLMLSAGKYARQAVLTAFEMIGGVQALAEWAEDNRGEFYTKLFTKTITRETEVEHRGSLEDYLDELDKHTIDVTPAYHEDVTYTAPVPTSTPAPLTATAEPVVQQVAQEFDMAEFYD